MQPTHRTKLSTANSLPPKSPPPVSYSLPRSLSPPAQSHYVPSRSPPMSPTPPLKTSANAHGHGHGHGRRPSLSSWLSRTSSNGSHVGPYAASKPVRISEPKLAHDLGLLGNYSRSGALGTGALVVRTPQEALAGSGVTPDYESGPEEDLIEEEESESEEVHVHQSQSDHHSQSQSQSEVNGSSIRVATRRRNSSSSQPESPPLPPLPLSKSTSALGSIKDLPPRTRTSPPSRPPPPPPPVPVPAPSAPSTAQVQAQHPPSRPAMKHSATSPILSSFPPVPPLPAHLAMTHPAPPFNAILLSTVPSHAIDKSKVIVTLETCTATHRTTLTTLLSRPSHLSTYLSSLFRSPSRFQMVRESTGRSVRSESQYSTHTSVDGNGNGHGHGHGHGADDATELASDADLEEEDGDTAFNSLFQNHLTASGLLPQTSYNIHIFLDRPSAT